MRLRSLGLSSTACGSGPLLLFQYRHANNQAYIESMRPRCVELARALKKTGSFYYPARSTGGHRPVGG